MRLKEIEDGVAAEKRLKLLTANAKLATDKAAQMKLQADVSSDRVKAKEKREKASEKHKAMVVKPIKPH